MNLNILTLRLGADHLSLKSSFQNKLLFTDEDINSYSTQLMHNKLRESCILPLLGLGEGMENAGVSSSTMFPITDGETDIPVYRWLSER